MTKTQQLPKLYLKLKWKWKIPNLVIWKRYSKAITNKNILHNTSTKMLAKIKMKVINTKINTINNEVQIKLTIKLKTVIVKYLF